MILVTGSAGFIGANLSFGITGMVIMNVNPDDEIAMPVSPTPTLPRREMGRTNRCSNFTLTRFRALAFTEIRAESFVTQKAVL